MGIKVLLDDDPQPPSRTPQIMRDQLPAPEDAEPVHTLSVSCRQRLGFDEDGNQVFEWKTIVEGQEAILYEEREVLDELSGTTRIVAKAVVLYNGDEKVEETAFVRSERGAYKVKSVKQTADRLEFEMERIDA